jgi:hypothetical protein
MSLTAWLQGNGRGLRIAPEKRDLLILDHVGNVQRLDHPLFVHPWSLEGRVKRSREAALSVKVCPQCFAAMPSARQTCPDCGHQFTPERRELQHVDGELVEVPPRDKGLKPGDEVFVNLGSGWRGGFVVESLDGKDRILVRARKEDGALGVHISTPAKDVQAILPFRHEQSRAQTVEDLIAIGKRRGMKNPRGWARHVIAARQAKGQWGRVA